MLLAIRIINATVNVFTIFIVIYSFISFILSPYHPIRETMARVIEPLIAPIRRVVPPVGGLDFSPLILMVLVQIVGSILAAVLRSLAG
ncbi:MAG: YggT family protein [Chloroflexota bacterium]|nr:YggT family protein [Chloroflexota bacterium]